MTRMPSLLSRDTLQALLMLDDTRPPAQDVLLQSLQHKSELITWPEEVVKKSKWHNPVESKPPPDELKNVCTFSLTLQAMLVAHQDLPDCAAV